MTLLRKAISMMFLAAASIAPATAFAHTALAGSTPASGSILPVSPDAVTLDFEEPVRLTSAICESRGEQRALVFSPHGRSSQFTIDAPNLAPGRNSILWKALSPDGHVVEGTIIIVIKPPTESSATPSGPRRAR